ncbi:MAG: hypothetical protein R3208_21320 [Ketobacteraceae bacterium]|nr:hypothetical protein [Ketobacteraceae bacterium]
MTKDPLDDLSMKPSRDELASRQLKGKPARRRAPAPDDKSPPPSAGKGFNGPVLVILLLIVVGASAGGWLMWQEVNNLSAELAQSKELLSESQSNLGNLQQNIASQSSAIDQTGNKIQEELEFHMSEIRKLWDLSNKTNKPAIEANEKAIASLKSTLSEQKKLIASAEAAATKSRDATESLKSQVKQNEVQTSVINTQMGELESRVSELAAQNKALKTMLESQEAAINRLEASSGKVLKEKLADIEQRLDSIDAFRRQVNSRLTQHDRSIAELHKSP